MQPVAFLSLLVVLCWTAAAQAQVAPSAAASSPNDRAQRDADKVFRMILMHADKPRRAAVRDEKAAPTAERPVAPARASTASPGGAPARTASEATPGDSKPAPSAAAPITGAPAQALATQAQPTDATPVAALAAPASTLGTTTPAAPKNVKLELVESVEPEFPSRLVRSLGSGSVVVQFDVLPDGSVTRPEVLRSSHKGLNAAAQAAVAAWRFKPISETAPGLVELKFDF